MVYYPEEIDEVIKGIFFQAANHLGRTSLRELLGIVRFYFEKRPKVGESPIGSL